MFDRWVLLLLASGGPSSAFLDSDAQLQGTANAASTLRLHLEVSGRTSPDCAARVLTIPISGRGAIHVVLDGVAYDGRATSNQLLVLRSNEARPLSLSGDETTGGRWSRGIDGRCVGTWRVSR